MPPPSHCDYATIVTRGPAERFLSSYGTLPSTAFELADFQKNALIGNSRATNITRKSRTPLAIPIAGGYPSRIDWNHRDHSKDGVGILRSRVSTLGGKTKKRRMMSLTNHAQRSLFLYHAQRTIKPIIWNPREKNPSGIIRLLSS